MSTTWQMNDRDTFSALLHAFEAQLSVGSNWLGAHLEGEGPVGAQPIGDEADPVAFIEVTPQEPFLDLRSLNGRRGRFYDIDLEFWSEPAELERIYRDYGQRWLTYADTYSATGWTFFVEDSVSVPGIEYNAGLAGRTLRTPAFAGAA